MALLVKSAHVVRLAGWSDPKPYAAGTTDDGASFPAGVSMSVCVMSDPHDFTVCKVDKEAVNAVAGVISSLTPGVEVEVEISKGYRNQTVLHSIKRAPALAKA